VVIGDINSRFAGTQIEFLEETSHKGLSYLESSDALKKPNQNAKFVIGAFKPLVPINNLATESKCFPGGLTFRRKNNWISELDYCFTSGGLINCIESFSVNQRTDIPSNHAPIVVKLDLSHFSVEKVMLKELYMRACELGECAITSCNKKDQHSRKQIKMSDLDKEKIYSALSMLVPPQVGEEMEVDTLIANIDNTLYQVAREVQHEYPHTPTLESTVNGSRWDRMMQSGDSKAIWGAINWKGTMQDLDYKDKPSDVEFKAHFEHLLNDDEAHHEVIPIDVSDSPYIPQTDDSITVRELEEAVKRVKMNKSGGPSGVPPGILKVLPATWIIFLTTLLNFIFVHSTYPASWSIARLVVIFKKGSRLVCDNYRGIAIMDSLAKIFDLILSKRLERWFQPDREQAGAQPGRSCTEHIVSLRLLMGYAKHTRSKLFVLYVDFSKAYDRVPREGLITALKALGCGALMLATIAMIYSNTQLVLGAAIISTCMGVRQGSPTSCFLFTLYVNSLIRQLKSQYNSDGFLNQLRCLMLMDDTVILPATCDECVKKFNILCEFCDRSGMVINAKKTKFMVVNGSDDDKCPIHGNCGNIENCDQYVYLGTMFTQDGDVLTSIAAHCKDKFSHVLKYASFVRTNCDFPFWVKEKVLNAALLSAILYGCESWITNDLHAPELLYMSALKTLLGVRCTTANKLCLAELGYPTLPHKVRKIQHSFLTKMLGNKA